MHGWLVHLAGSPASRRARIRDSSHESRTARAVLSVSGMELLSTDAGVLALALVFFFVTAGLVRLCERL